MYVGNFSNTAMLWSCRAIIMHDARLPAFFKGPKRTMAGWRCLCVPCRSGCSRALSFLSWLLLCGTKSPRCFAWTRHFSLYPAARGRGLWLQTARVSPAAALTVWREDVADTAATTTTTAAQTCIIAARIAHAGITRNLAHASLSLPFITAGAESKRHAHRHQHPR